jgi:hypothetical protein
MRLILVLILIVGKLNCIAQKITDNFDSIVSKDDFLSITGNWEQRFNSTDFYITENGNYVIKNKSASQFSVSMHKPELALSTFQVSVSLKMDGSKKTESGIGILLNARTDGSGAIICELNGKNQYRVRKFVNGQWDILSFAGDNGWNRDKAIKNKSFNEMVVKCDNGIFDFYINSIFIFSFTDKKLTSGNIGVYANGNSSGKIDYIKIFAKNIATPSDTNLIKTESPYITPPSESSISDNEVVLLLKSKIDKQQKKITELTKEIEKCKLQKSGDTSLEKVNIELVKQNESLFIEKGKLEIELRQAKETIAEYELLKKQLESNDNGDIILTLNNFINREKRKNQELQQKLILLQTENNQLKDSLKELQKEKK